ncbi:MAG: NADH-quinone oxidoreductase subunit A [Armatimonadota bacterium]
MNSYIPVLVLAVLAAILAVGMVVLSFLLGPKRPDYRKVAPYECGVTPVGSAREKFPIKFFLVAMLFIVFDVETIFLYPWAVTFKDAPKAVQAFNLIEMGVFIVILFVGYFYMLGTRALEWEEPERAQPRRVQLSAVAQKLEPASQQEAVLPR